MNPVTNRIYVANRSSGDVTVIDGATRATATVAVGADPDAVAVNPVTNRIYVANGSSNTVTVIDGADDTSATVPVGMLPFALAVNALTNTVWVANATDGTVTLIDGGTNATTTVSAGARPQAIAVNPATHRIYVANGGDADVTVMGSTAATLGTVAAGIQPSAIAVNPATNKNYVANYGSNTVTVISEEREAAVPLSAGIVPLVQNQSAASSVGFTFRPLSAFFPTAPPPQNVFFQVDAREGPWTAAAGAGGTFSATVPALPPGFHILYAVADDGQDATSNQLDSPLVGAVAAYGFLVGANAGVPGAPVVFVRQPSSQTVNNGRSVVFAALAQDQSGGSLSYQWYLNAIPIPGAVDPTYLLSNAGAQDRGVYTCLATNPSGAATSNGATLDVIDSQDPGHLVDISCRSSIGTATSQLIVGFVLGGAATSGSESVLIRASGPALVPFGVNGALPDPELQLDGSGGTLATNDGWAGSAAVAAAADAVGAFAWSDPSSRDSALVEALPGGPYTAAVSGASGDSGIALAEVYDAAPAGSYQVGSPRLVNFSARAQSATNAQALIVGFVIEGTTSMTVLVRAAGPALAAFGVTGALADPQLELDGSDGTLATNAGWGGDPQIAAAATAVGAFNWPNPNSPDSAILMTLAPGAYTALVSGAGGDTGIALVEVYEVF